MTEINIPKISVIIPAYNSEKYLERCIVSVMNQSFQDFECIVVNDGSQDNTKTILETLSLKYAKLKNFHKENGGVSSARNYGLAESNGQYVVFIDSDDYILQDYLLAIHEITEKDYFDCIVFNYYKNKNNELFKIKNDYLINKNMTLTKTESIEKILENIIPASVWMGAFNRKSINNLRFEHGLKLGEDLLFLYKFLNNSKKNYLDKRFFYVYSQDTEGVTKNPFNLYILEGITKVIEEISLSFKSKEHEQLFLSFLFHHLTIHIVKADLKTLLKSKESEYYGKSILNLRINKVNGYKKKIALFVLKIFYMIIFARK